MADSHEKLYDILLAIKEDLGGIKVDVGSVKNQLKTLNGQVADHSSFIFNLKGKVAVISSAVGIAGSILVLWIKEKFNL